MKRLIVWTMVVFAGGCGGGGFKVADYPTPETLMQASREQFRMGNFAKARVGFQRVTFEVPANDPLGGDARYYLAECDFATGDYDQAARTFRRVADDYEDHPLAADALLRAGDALAARWNRAELDPTAGEEALASYQELANRFPESRAAERARMRLGELSNKFAEKQYRSGVFYSRLKAYDSAIIYYRAVVAEYGQSPWAPLALLKLVEAYRHINYKEELAETCSHLRQYYPGTPGLEDNCPPPVVTPPA